MKPVIMAGGSGSRLWPLSRALYPKQFLPLASDQTMLQDTLARIDGLCDAAPILICNEEHRFIVAEQLRAQSISASILLEPVGRNTAPAIALAAMDALAQGEDPLLLVLAAGFYNWRRVRPRLGDDAGTRTLRLTSAVELIGGALVVIATAMLVATPLPG